MNGPRLPTGLQLEALSKRHRRKAFRSGQPLVDRWLAAQALQNQSKHLSVTKVLADAEGNLAGYYSLASGQVDFSDLPPTIAKQLPKRALPVALLAWLGVDVRWQGRGLGERLLALSLRDCYQASSVFPFVAVILDCVDDRAKQFYQRFDFAELPGHPYRLYLPAAQLEALLAAPVT